MNEPCTLCGESPRQDRSVFCTECHALTREAFRLALAVWLEEIEATRQAADQEAA